MGNCISLYTCLGNSAREYCKKFLLWVNYVY
nr:MAG TPA: hypothetical protein [Caudoviricetes sp.]DAN72686.1 MAG TPA: hypothetical protein [Caudoviricetes sp.]DAX50381.1 MAG TPA: hypothetical protein [Caudoviricetes sp.]